LNERPPQSFLFADLAGYTAMTEAMGDDEAARVIEGYCSSVRGHLGEYGAHEVKSIGDALLIRVPKAEAAVRLGLRIALEIGAQHGFPAVRVGMHHGPAIERDGDFFGRTINIAARVAAVARGGEILVTEDVVQASGKLESVRFIERGRHPLKGIDEPVVIYLAAAGPEATPDGLPMDPVCHMGVDPDRAAGRLTYEGRDYCFCSLRCARRFAEDPGRFT
jgi:adenylate cyclase